MVNKEKLKQKIEELQNKLRKIEELEEAKKNKVKTLIIDNVEYETKEHDFNLTFKEAVKKCPKGWRLWTAEECIKLHNSIWKDNLNLNDCWFFIEQPLNFNKNNNYVARFIAVSDWADVNCGRYPSGSGPALGVRFCKDLKVRK